MTNEEIVQTYWDQFEVLAFRAVKSELPQDLVFEETITQSIKDGGYDGEFIPKDLSLPLSVRRT